MRSKNNTSHFEYDANKFKYLFLVSLSKLNSVDTSKTANEEIKNLLRSYYIDNELMNFVFNCVSETSEHHKITTKREYIKILILIAESLAEKLEEYLPKIFNILNKKLHESEPHLNQAISDTYGAIFEKVISKLAPNQGFKSTQQILQGIYSNLNDSNKNLQIATSMCLIKLIQNCPLEFLINLNNEITKNILEFLRAPHFKAQTHLLEALLSLILSIEKEFKNNVNEVIEYILETFSKQNNLEWTIKKISIDVIYTLAIILKETIIPYKDYILQLLQERKCDKIKYVREAALIAINILKNLDGNPKNADEYLPESFKNSYKYDQNSFHNKNPEINPSLKEIYEKYKNPDLNQKRYSVGRLSNNNPDNIYKKYLSENKKMAEDIKSNSYMNSPSHINYDSNKMNLNDNKANSTNGYLQRSNILANDNVDDGQRNSSQIAHQDLEYLFNKMEIIMIQQNKIYENFINFETNVKNEINEIKQKVGNLENSVYGASDSQPFMQPRSNSFMNKTKNEELKRNNTPNEKPNESRTFSIEKTNPIAKNNENFPYRNLKKDPADAYSLINNHYSSFNDIKKNLNKFKETSEYIQQKYDFNDSLGQNKKNEEEKNERKRIEQHIMQNEFSEALNLSFNLYDLMNPLRLIFDYQIDLQIIKKELLERLFERITQIAIKKENLNVFFGWIESCCKNEILKNNIKIMRITVILNQILESEEKKSMPDHITILNLKKIMKMIE